MCDNAVTHEDIIVYILEDKMKAKDKEHGKSNYQIRKESNNYPLAFSAYFPTLFPIVAAQKIY